MTYHSYFGFGTGCVAQYADMAIMGEIKEKEKDEESEIDSRLYSMEKRERARKNTELQEKLKKSFDARAAAEGDYCPLD